MTDVWAPGPARGRTPLFGGRKDVATMSPKRSGLSGPVRSAPSRFGRPMVEHAGTAVWADHRDLAKGLAAQKAIETNARRAMRLSRRIARLSGRRGFFVDRKLRKLDAELALLLSGAEGWRER